MEVLLTSEDFIKSISNVSDNLAGRFLKPSIREAQEIELRGVLGTALLEKVKSLIPSAIESGENAPYKALLNECQYFLAYSAIVEVLGKITYKIGNFGVSKSSDENLQVASREEIDAVRAYYQSKADSYCLLLQTYIYEHRNELPELTASKCREIHDNLYSAASCGIFLGGARGKGSDKRGCGL